MQEDSNIFDDQSQSGLVKYYDLGELGQMRIVRETDGNIVFCGKDAARGCGYFNTNEALSRHCRGVVKRYPIVDQLGRTQEANFYSEADIYRLMAHGRTEKCIDFEAKVFNEILPSIRKTGGYIAGQEAMTEEELLSRAVLVAQNVIASKDKLIAEMAPKALFADAVGDSKTLILIRDLAHMMKQNGIEIGEKRLFNWLRENGYLEKHRNEPTQRSLDLKVIKVVEGQRKSLNGSIFITRTPKITGKGQRYFIEKLCGQKAIVM